MSRHIATSALFCLLASLTIAGNPAPTSAQATEDQQCVTTLDGGETCVSASAQCDRNALDVTRAGIVIVWITNLSTHPLDVTATVAQLEPRQLSVTANQSGFIRVTGRLDANHAVAVQLTGPGIPDGIVDGLQLTATSWCSPAPTVIDCVAGASVVQVTLDNSIGMLPVELALVDFGEATTTPAGVVNAGEITTLSFEPDDPLRFYFQLLAVGSRARPVLLSERVCTFEATDCSLTTPSIPADECTAVRDILIGLGWDEGTLRSDLCSGTVRCDGGHVTEVTLIEACSLFCADAGERMLSPSIGRLSQLERIRILYAGVYDIPVTGPIPPEIGQLTNLVSLVLLADFEGPIPTELGQLESLIELNLRDNRLTGPIPPSIASLPSLRTVDLAANQLDGPIPANLGDVDTLRSLDLSGNRLAGAVPSNLIREGIEELNLSSNLLDSLPIDAGPVAGTDARERILIADNQLSGPLPTWLPTVNVDTIDLSGNNLTGPLPQTIGNLSIQQLDLSNNAISGTIPDSIGTITWERPTHYDRPRLDLSDNQLTGTIPAGIAAAGLVELALARNDLEGPIPTLIAGSEIDTLDLETNRISGTLNQDLFDLTRNSGLMWLNVSDNALTGELPQTPPMQKFFVADNMLTGAIPNEFGPAMELDLSRNALSGTMPRRMFNVTDFAGFVRTVRIARLGGNSFSGPLPTTLESIAPWSIEELVLLPNGCLTAEPSTAAVLPSFGIDPNRLCESPGVQKFCRDRPVTVDLALGHMPTPGDDVILGSPGDDLIAAGEGDDLICGLGGHDTIWGQGGNDEIHGDGGSDRIRGGAGDDLLFGHAGNDDISGGTGNDEVWGQAHDDNLRGGSGDDLVHGGAGNDWNVAGNGGVDQVFGGDGDDRITGGPRGDTISGGAGNDIINGNGGADKIAGNGGDDDIRGGPQTDAIDGGDGNDDCNGGTNNAVVPDQAIRCETESNFP